MRRSLFASYKLRLGHPRPSPTLRSLAYTPARMGKSNDDVISEFNEYVNMTKDELQKWLDNPESDKAGLGPGKESGHKIVDILSRNPSKTPDKYTDADVDHMRRVAAYCKRHLAQEGHMKDEKSPEELAHAKSTISLKNWGHDPTKNKSGNDVKESGGGEASTSKGKGKKAPAKKAGTKRTASKKKADEQEEEAEEPRDDAEGDEQQVEAEHAGEDADGAEEPPTKKAKGGAKKGKGKK